MEQKQYHYDAFISYRHTELDKFVAENLHKQLEAYRMPKNTRKGRTGQKNRIERIFRDKDELPLTSNLEDPIIQALHNSEWLLVICSPRLRESAWCKKEIETFVKLRGKERVLAVLIEGEPAESFPDELLSGEPLAADVRGKDKKEVLKNIKSEMLRILAAMFEVPYDDLRQRHRERRMKRIMTVSLAATAAGVLFGGYCAATALRISNQNKQIEAQSEEIAGQNEKLAVNQALSLAEKAMDYLEEGDREEALQAAYEALTQVDGVDMPYTPQAHHALAKSLRAYDVGMVYKPSYQIELMGIVKDIQISPDSNYAAIYDDTGALTVWDISNQKEVLRLPAKDVQMGLNEGYAFLPGGYLICVGEGWTPMIYQLSTGQVEKVLEQRAFAMCVDPAGKYIYLEDILGEAVLYDAATFEQIGTVSFNDNMSNSKLFFGDGSIMAICSRLTGQDMCQVQFIDVNNMQTLSCVELAVSEAEDMIIRGDKAYIGGSILGAYPDDHISRVYGCDITKGEVLWEHQREGCIMENLELSDFPQANNLLLITNELITLINTENGANTFTSIINSKVVSSYYNDTAADYHLFCQDGSQIKIIPGMDFTIDQSTQFDCKTANNKYIVQSFGKILVAPENSNCIAVYTVYQDSNLKECERTFSARESTLLSGEEAMETVRSFGLEDADFVKYADFDAEKRYLFINYWNGDLTIYDTTEKRLVGTEKNISLANGYWGKDHNGYTYLSGINIGYVLNQNMELMLEIPNMVDVDFENDKVYLRAYQRLYEAPLYTAEQLVEMAKERIR